MGTWNYTAVYGNGWNCRVKADTEIAENQLQMDICNFNVACADWIYCGTLATLLDYGAGRIYCCCW